MTERPSLFRQEALEFQAGRPGEGSVLRADPRWTTWLYWIVLTLVVAGVAVTATARTSETTSGPALINVQGRTFVALVPDAASADVQRGELVRLQVDGPEGRPLAARVLRAEVADQAGVRRAGFASSSQPGTLVTRTRVSLQATTTDGLGALGRAEGLAAVGVTPLHGP